MGMKIGYARVSTSGQNLDIQLERLSDCDRIYQEKVSAASTRNRPELKNALDFVREDDVFVVTKLDRLAHSVVDLSNVVQRLEDKKVDSTPAKIIKICHSPQYPEAGLDAFAGSALSALTCQRRPHPEAFLDRPQQVMSSKHPCIIHQWSVGSW